jgi:CRISP-associated protein Cas1
MNAPVEKIETTTIPTVAHGADDYLPARMINEAVYCPRLFYFMHVEGQFAESADTEEGSQIHARVDGKVDALPAPKFIERTLFDLESPDAKGVADSPMTSSGKDFDSSLSASDKSDAIEQPIEEAKSESIHARSVTLASESLKVVAKLDLIEGTGNRVTPVEYKRGSPKRGSDGMPTAWDPERVQLCLQALILRENGFECNQGVLYFAETRQRITIVIDEALIELTKSSVASAKLLTEQSSPPPPLVDIPKCPRCSLVAICLPDEKPRFAARISHS